MLHQQIVKTMKKIYFLLIAAIFILPSCLNFEDCKLLSGSSNATTLNGDTDIPVNAVGNTFSTLGLKVGDNWVDMDPTIEIVESEDGVNTVRIKANLSADPNLAALDKIIPDELKDAEGRVNFDMDVKITSEGWLDYSNVDKEPVVLVKYDSNVGDKYSVTTSSGSKIVREVTHKSTTDDFDYGFYQIKVIKVEQETSFPGMKKYVAYFNHKFGLVGLEIIAEDGTTLSSQISASTF